jgi:hypothetical protein
MEVGSKASEMQQSYKAWAVLQLIVRQRIAQGD